MRRLENILATLLKAFSTRIRHESSTSTMTQRALQQGNKGWCVCNEIPFCPFIAQWQKLLKLYNSHARPTAMGIFILQIHMPPRNSRKLDACTLRRAIILGAMAKYIQKSSNKWNLFQNSQ
jgi:hypothetical protein